MPVLDIKDSVGPGIVQVFVRSYNSITLLIVSKVLNYFVYFNSLIVRLAFDKFFLRSFWPYWFISSFAQFNHQIQVFFDCCGYSMVMVVVSVRHNLVDVHRGRILCNSCFQT